VNGNDQCSLNVGGYSSEEAQT